MDQAKDFSYVRNEDNTMTLTAYSGAEAEENIPSEIGGAKVTGIASECFSGNVKLAELTVPEGVTWIRNYAFECCSALRSVNLPETLVRIGEGAFSDCGMLASVDLGGVERIGSGAFLYCGKLEALVLPESLSGMGDFAFTGCVAFLLRVSAPAFLENPKR